MSNKKKFKLKKKVKGKNTSSKINEEIFWQQIDDRIRKSFINMIQPLESRVDHMVAAIDNAKSNIIVTNTVLEKKGIVNQEEFFAEFKRYLEEEKGGVDGCGQMVGSPIMSLYNLEG